MRHRYRYRGRVFLNDHLVLNMWDAEVVASCMKEANLALRKKFKEQYKLDGNQRVRLFGKFIKLETVI